MLSNYLRVAFRNLFKHKGYSFINVAGLALGMACCLIILLWVMDELSYDRFHENAENLYRVEQDQNYSGEVYHVNVTPYPMGPELKEEIPEIEDASRYSYTGTLLLRYGEKAFFEGGVRAVDPSFLKMFTFPLILGDESSALNQPHSLVISEEMADKYFGVEDPLGKTIMVNNTFALSVTGVMKNVPQNSFLDFDILVPFDFMRYDLEIYNESWSSNSITTLVQLHENASIPDVNEKISVLRYKRVEERYMDDPEDLKQFREAPRVEFSVSPYTKLHLFSYFGFGKPVGNIQYVYIFTIVAMFVLFIACINFMNLATARSAGRAREVGLRKVVGAFRRHLVGQFYGEAIVLSFIALIFAILLVMLLLPRFNTLSGKEMAMDALFGWKFLIGMIGITLLTGIVSGSYPALFLSAFQPIKVLRGSMSTGARSALFRKILVVTQFSLSVLLIIGTGVVYKQLHHMRSKKLGYEKEHLIYLPLRGDTRQSYDALKEEMRKDPRIENVTATWHQPTYFGSNSGGADWDGKDPEQSVLISFNVVDFDYMETMKIELAEGRSFSKDFSTDTSSAFLVNEEVVKIMGVESAAGRRFSFIGTDGTIVGVMKNFHFQPVRFGIEPLALVISPNWFRYMVVRLGAGNTSEALEAVESVWQKIVPNYPFEYHFLDEDFDRMYRAEERMGNLLQAFAVLAILIASLGLFGLASFTAEQRTKEIGVRKVLGASLPGLMLLLSKEFTKWVIVSNVIAWPLAYFVLKNWLQEFAYRTPLSWWIFVGSGLLALAIALLTVSYQAVKAALANPVESLRYE